MIDKQPGFTFGDLVDCGEIGNGWLILNLQVCKWFHMYSNAKYL